MCWGCPSSAVCWPPRSSSLRRTASSSPGPRSSFWAVWPPGSGASTAPRSSAVWAGRAPLRATPSAWGRRARGDAGAGRRAAQSIPPVAGASRPPGPLRTVGAGGGPPLPGPAGSPGRRVVVPRLLVAKLRPPPRRGVRPLGLEPRLLADASGGVPGSRTRCCWVGCWAAGCSPAAASRRRSGSISPTTRWRRGALPARGAPWSRRRRWRCSRSRAWSSFSSTAGAGCPAERPERPAPVFSFSLGLVLLVGVLAQGVVVYFR